ncbi:hypothetical protein FO519_009460 [Halicephalobus sp. NKZ332]|nr:hypothetical protein FO519_009460 [Halicephalobus sp. NKZ332]
MVETTDWTDVSFEEARQTLKKWREDHARRSEETVEIWEHVLSRYASSLNDELWSILEQVAVAAIDSARFDLAADCLQRLKNQFPQSSRVMKLHAMRLEATGQLEDAEKLYNQLISADETNPGFRKRKIAILLAKGERLEAIKNLNEYLETFINDNEAWVQLSELYLKEGDYSRAAYAFDESLLSNPHSSLNFRRIAEIRYAIGGQENHELSKAYFEKSTNMSESDVRSLFGLVLSCNQLIPKATPSKKKELVTSGIKAADKLLEIYKSLNENPHSDVHVRTIMSIKNQLNQMNN